MLVKKQELVKKGAEAYLYLGIWFGKKVLIKHRIPKSYREPSLDKNIRITRTLNEARALTKVKSYGVNVPLVYDVDTKNAIIYMKYIDGHLLKILINHLSKSQKRKILHRLGEQVSILHKNGHIHSDITTSNVIVTSNNIVFLIDFGLHFYSDKIEDKAVDLHLFKRVLTSSHGEFLEECFPSFLSGYKKEYGSESNLIIKHFKTIETRGRYVKKEKRK